MDVPNLYTTKKHPQIPLYALLGVSVVLLFSLLSHLLDRTRFRLISKTVFFMSILFDIELIY
ncbi:hypothetical protein WAF17_12985 [Bernardetia sp. ABR2-2B]|uniref:hypothetical protein n=1 Tax=Bernardetia sp. ABR2-2B TaxID=3127472 RepID=UPI0030D13CB5